MTPLFVTEISRNAKRQRRSLYECECGATFEALEYNVKAGHTKSCGCRTAALISASRLTHNESRPQTAEYRAWSNMKSRCLNVRCRNYNRYGGRGIRVAQVWIDSYEAFLAHVGRRPTPRHSIDRIENEGHYEPGNVRWATPSEQARNRRPPTKGAK